MEPHFEDFPEKKILSQRIKHRIETVSLQCFSLTRDFPSSLESLDQETFAQTAAPLLQQLHNGRRDSGKTDTLSVSMLLERQGL